MQHRRLRLRSASQGSAPAPAAQHDSTATQENQEHLTRVQTGNSVSPLDKTYHGGPRTILKSPWTVNTLGHNSCLQGSRGNAQSSDPKQRAGVESAH